MDYRAGDAEAAAERGQDGSRNGKAVGGPGQNGIARRLVGPRRTKRDFRMALGIRGDLPIGRICSKYTILHIIYEKNAKKARNAYPSELLYDTGE